MKVILIEDVKKVGKKGEIVEVSEGYARNFLLPKNLAKEGNKTNINDAKQKQNATQHKSQVAFEEATVLANQLQKIEVSIPVRTGENGRIFGSVTAKDVSEAIENKYQIKIEKKKIEMDKAIHSLGRYQAIIRVHPKISSKILVEVVKE